MPRETIASLKAKNAELEMQNNKYFDAWLKLDQERQKEVTESAQYKALKEHYELEQKNSKALRSMLTDARSKNNKYLDELNTLKRKMQADINKNGLRIEVMTGNGFVTEKKNDNVLDILKVNGQQLKILQDLDLKAPSQTPKEGGGDDLL